MASLASAAPPYGGAGLVFHDERASYYDPGTPWAGKLQTELGCIGGTAFRVAKDRREGGQLNVCAGLDDALVTGGPQFGWLSHGGGFYASLYGSAGFGAFSSSQRYAGVLAYVEPNAAIAWAPGPFAVELGAYLGLPLEVIAWSANDTLLGPGEPHFGAKLSPLLGNFHERYPEGVEIHAPDGAEVQ